MSVTNHQEWIRLSNVLSESLDIVGASEDIRRLKQNNAITNDILTTSFTRANVNPCAIYTFGSFVEGTTTSGLKSDIDTLICAEYPAVVEDPGNSDGIKSLLLVQDDITPAGYAKLQLIKDGVVLCDAAWDNCSIDYFGRPVVCQSIVFEGMTHDLRIGPAGRTLATLGCPDIDHVPSFQCRTWPEQAKPWLYRLRSLGHPTAKTIDAFKSIGCFLVPVGQPFSAEKEIQWRLSFSVQERKLMMGLNTTQYKCYVCLKMIKNAWIKPTIKGESLTSYHCKTCLFYMLEVNEEKLWTTDNLIRCVFACVNTIKIWVRSGFIPNYFIPEENMWKGNREMQEALVNNLDKLLQKGPEFVFILRCDHVGILVQRAASELGHKRPKVEAALAVEKLHELDRVFYSGEVNETDLTVYSECWPFFKKLVSKFKDRLSLSDEENLIAEERGNDEPDAQSEKKGDEAINSTPEVNGLFKQAAKTIDLALYKFLHQCKYSTLENAREILKLLGKGDDFDASIIELVKAIKYPASQVGRVSKDFTETEMERAFMFLLPYLYTRLGSLLAVKALKCTEDVLRKDYLDLSMSTLIGGYNCNAHSGMLKHAAALFMLGKYLECERILLELEKRYDELHVTSCDCFEMTNDVIEALCDKICRDRPSMKEMLHCSVSGCVIYLPAEIDIVPHDLKYEMFRSVFAETPKIPGKDDFFGCAHVDSAIFLYYLQYRLYQLLDRSENDLKHALDKMVRVMQEDLNLGHPETANNLFGRILMDQRDWPTAVQRFCDSWRIRPDHNAAKWHMAILINKIVGVKSEPEENVQDDEADNEVIVLYKRTTSNYL